MVHLPFFQVTLVPVQEKRISVFGGPAFGRKVTALTLGLEQTPVGGNVSAQFALCKSFDIFHM